jgi:hypothetical protein
MSPETLVLIERAKGAIREAKELFEEHEAFAKRRRRRTVDSCFFGSLSCFYLFEPPAAVCSDEPPGLPSVALMSRPAPDQAGGSRPHLRRDSLFPDGSSA